MQKEESIDTILEMAEYREKGTVLIAAGCLTQRYARDLYEEIPRSIYIAGGQRVSQTAGDSEGISGAEKTRFRHRQCGERLLRNSVRRPEPGAYYSYLENFEGCDKVCSYCIIPSIRGHYRSRKMEDIVREAEFLASKGCTELILIAQDVTAYGIDLYGRSDSDAADQKTLRRRRNPLDTPSSQG